MTITTRRGSRLYATILMSAALVLGACGSAESTPEVAAGQTPGYPLTIDTQFGPMTLNGKPERIVVLGSPRDVDILAALGEPPFAYSAGSSGTVEEALSFAPWLDADSFQQYVPGLFEADFSPAREAIASLDPDLIIFFGAGAALDQQGYDQLAQVAPTYAYAFLPPWREEITTVGALVGKPEMAAQLVEDVDRRFAQAREQIPGLQGMTFFHGVATPDGIYTMSAAVDLFTALGMEPAANQPLPPSRPVTLSPENLDQLDADVVFLGGEGDPRATLEQDPRFAELPSVRSGSMVFLQPLLGKVMIPSQLGPASVPWLLDRLLPELEKSPLSADR